MLIGLTGQIGAGKTEVAIMLRQLGAAVIDADQIGREVVERNSSVLKQLTKRFGADILTPQKKLHRKRLAELAFKNQSSRKALDKIVHPPLLKELKRQANTLLRKHRIVVIDAALLLEWKQEKAVDLVLVVTAPQTVRLRRLQKRGMSKADALARQRQQASYTEFRSKADILIPNSGSKTALCARVKQIWTRQLTD